MQFGVYMFPTDQSVGPAELARAVEARGFESLLFPEHTHIPASRESQWPGEGELPEEYRRTLDPFVALGAAAAATTTLKIGTGICLVVEHDPITLAKQVASLDFLSGGRFLFGVGGGWNREEMANHGTKFPRRWKVMRERIEAIKAIWGSDTASYHGEFVNFDAIWSYPKPVQKPHPPILVAGNGAGTLKRVVRYGDEWLPTYLEHQTVLPRLPELRELAAQAGRGEIPVSLYGAPGRADKLAPLREAGISRVLFGVPSAGPDRVLRRLDSLAEAMRELG